VAILIATLTWFGMEAKGISFERASEGVHP